METWLDQSILYEGRVVSLKTGNVRLEDGTEGFREIVEHPGGVGIVPWTGEHVLMARQYRVAIEQTILEIPAGKMEPNESSEERGRAELEEEIGCTAGQMIPIGCIYPSVGFLTERIDLFIATDLTHVGQKLEEDERIEVVEMTLDEVRAKLDTHEFSDAKTVAGLYRLLHFLGE